MQIQSLSAQLTPNNDILGLYHDSTKYCILIDNFFTHSRWQSVNTLNYTKQSLRLSKSDSDFHGLNNFKRVIICNGQLQIFHRDNELKIFGYVPIYDDCKFYSPGAGIKACFQYRYDAGIQSYDPISLIIFRTTWTREYVPHYCYYSDEKIKLKIKNDLDRNKMFTLPFDNENYDMLSCGMLTYKNSDERLAFASPRPMAARKFTYSSDFVAYYNSRSVYFYRYPDDTDYPKLMKRIRAIKQDDPIVDVKFSPDGKYLLVVSKSKIYIYQDLKLIKTMLVDASENRIKNGIEFCAWAKDGLTFAVCSKTFLYTFDLDF